MDTEIHHQHEEFRRLTRNEAAHIIQYYPGAAVGNWVCECYQSLDAFTRRFPNAVDRKNILARITQTRAECRRAKYQAMQQYPSIFKSASGSRESNQ